ncbi:Aldo/keto reductase [Phellopilus nigrolimitatus]|nr:Aldo/keto reductase [Phellopilus nigrolimitatus]
MKSYSLNDGKSVPWLAFGTGTALYEKNCTDVASRALALGFTHLDGAQMYRNEDSLGAAIDTYLSASGDEGTRKKKRDALYVTTKLDKIPAGKGVEDTLRESLSKLRVDFVDLFLVHHPLQHVDRPGGLQQVWREMVDVKAKGLVKSIGVSNFNKAQLEEVVSLGLDVPAVNQIEYHPFLARRLAPLIAYHRAHNIRTASYGGLTPILPSRSGGSDNADLQAARGRISQTLDALAAAHSATQGQVLLKWLQSEGVIAATTSSKDERIREYLAADALSDLSEAEKRSIEEAVGDVHFRAFASFPHMDQT